MKTPSTATAKWTEFVPSDRFQSGVMIGSTVSDKLNFLLMCLAK